MKKIPCLMILVLIILFAACTGKRGKVAAEKESYEKAKETLEQKEKKNPVLFLTVTSHDKTT
jgi:PBP1b-binding outer membrane lipoprotein LpoB